MNLTALATLQRSGLATIAPLLSSDEVSDLRAYLQDRPLATPNGGLLSFSDASQTAGMAAYPLEVILANTVVRRFANHPVLIGLARGYLGCKPTISSIGIRWSFPNRRAPDLYSVLSQGRGRLAVSKGVCLSHRCHRRLRTTQICTRLSPFGFAHARASLFWARHCRSVRER